MPGRERPKRGVPRSNPLGDDLQASRYAHARLKNDGESAVADDDEHDLGAKAGFVIPTRLTQRILRTARAQLETVRQEEEEEQQQHEQLPRGRKGMEDEETLLSGERQTAEEDGVAAALSSTASHDHRRDNHHYAHHLGSAFARMHEELAEQQQQHHRHHNDHDKDDANDSTEADVELDYDDTESVMSETASEVGDMGETLYGIDEEEARLLQKFQPVSRAQGRNLADMIGEKIRETEGISRASAGARGSRPDATGGAHSSGQPHSLQGDAEDEEEKIDSRVARVYTAIGGILKNYTSGKIPKAFKILPNIRNWEQLLLLTKPDQWSPHATYQATRIFAANLNEAMAQRFYAAVLLPMVHTRLIEDRKLHPALYMAVRKALFRPVAFFKGFLLPLATDEECTLKEALVVASVLQRCHLPPVPTAVTIVKLSQHSFTGPCSVFLRVLIDKKMALPYQAIDALVAYFYRFVRTHTKEETLPVLWHQTLLSFSQRYKNDFTPEQVGLLLQVCTMHFHYLITPEIRRELAVAQRAHAQKAQMSSG